MSNFKLNLPTDIPWQRICVTEDMLDKVVCDERLPAKWQSSMAVFKYVPENEYQLYPNYNITYLKVTATITGYQPLDQEIQGQIDWDGIDVSTIDGLTDLLNSYNSCHGAILQVVVGPPGKNPAIPLKNYPFFLDFEPKKRELYELATDTQEKSSRSIETLNVTKSSGNTQSQEVMDIDMGGGGFGAEYDGVGVNYAAGNGQWGTKRMNGDESLSARSTETGQEKRETFSFSTQISQMYHLLDSYHLGTNRVVFFIQPRPHTLEEPSGFVKGPRQVEGMQEFFLVVAQPKDQEEFCVSLRLDTSHLTKIPIMEYERRSVISEPAIANANLPTSLDTFVERRVRWHVDYLAWTDDIYYKHFKRKVTANEVYLAPDNFVVQNYTNLVNSNTGSASSSVSTSADRRSLTINAEATSHIWIQDEGDGACIDNCPPDTLDESPARAERQLKIDIISTLPTVQTGEEEVLMITTRGLCCCSSDANRIRPEELVVGIKRVPDELSVVKYLNQAKNTKGPSRQKGEECQCNDKTVKGDRKQDARHTIRLANELSNFVKTETIKSLNDPSVKLVKFHETDFFLKQLEYKLVSSGRGKKTLQEQGAKHVPPKALPKLEKHFGKKATEISVKDLLSLRQSDFAAHTGLKPNEINMLKMKILGVKFKSVKSDNRKK